MFAGLAASFQILFRLLADRVQLLEDGTPKPAPDKAQNAKNVSTQCYLAQFACI